MMFHRLTTKYVCGVDLHAKTFNGCVMDLEGHVLKRQTIPCQPMELIEFLRPWKKNITVGVESTYNWYWFIDALEKEKIPCVLGHALYIKRKMSGKHKTDKVDATGISHLLRTDQFPVAYRYPKEMRTVRDLLRRRHFFVQRRGGTFTHFQTSLHQDGCIESLRNKLQYKSTRQSLVDLTVNADLKKNLNTDLEYIGALDKITEDLEKTIIDKANHHNRKNFEALMSIPGCGKITALTILYESHTVERFKTVGRFCSYARVVRADNASAGKDLGRSANDKIGNAHLKWAFSEIAVAMIKYYPIYHEWYEKQAVQHGTGGAMARLRHKLAVTAYYLMKRNQVFDGDKFLGTQDIDRTATSAHNLPETSGHESEPFGLIEKPSGHLSKEKKPCKKKTTKLVDTTVSKKVKPKKPIGRPKKLSLSQSIKQLENMLKKKVSGRQPFRTTGSGKVLTKSRTLVR